MTDTEILNALEATLADAMTVEFHRIWLNNGRTASWQVGYKAQFDNPKNSISALGGGYTLRDAVLKAIERDGARRANLVAEALSK